MQNESKMQMLRIVKMCSYGGQIELNYFSDVYWLPVVRASIGLKTHTGGGVAFFLLGKCVIFSSNFWDLDIFREQIYSC